MNENRDQDEDGEKVPILKKNSLFRHLSEPEIDFSINESSDESFDQRFKITSKKSVVLTIFNTFRSFVAIGVLTLPYATSLIGPIPAFFGLLFIALLVYLATDLVIEVADDSKFKGANYETLGKMMWGRPGKQVILIVLYLCSLACFIGGILFSADFLDFAFCSHGFTKLCHQKTRFIFIAFGLCIIIATIQSLKPFGYISLFSTLVIIVGILSITYYNFEFIITTEVDLRERVNEFHMKNFFSFLGIGLYTTEGLNLIIPLRNSFNDNKHFPTILYSTFVFVVWCYITLGVFSYIVS